MILILTNSNDFTTNDVISKLQDIPLFRFNIDLWQHYQWNIGPDDFTIEDPTGRICRQRDVKAVYLRKLIFDPAFIDVPAGGSEETWRREELMQLWLGLRDWAHETGRLALVKPSSHGRWSKIRQMKLATEFFPVPEWRVFRGSAPDVPAPVVVKTLGANNTGNGAILVVREVDQERLSPGFSWFIQHKLVEASHDVTVVWVAGKQFAYELARNQFDGDDVRVPSFEQNLKWSRVTLPEDEGLRIQRFMERTGLDYGRLDFLRMNDRLWFLEVNPNGQFAWLDPEGEDGLIDAVADAIRQVWLANSRADPT